MNTLIALAETYSILLVVNNEEVCLDDCLKRLSFASVLRIALRKGYWEKGYGILISIYAALYPLVSLLRAMPEEAENNRL
jgi:hypothetical protein